MFNLEDISQNTENMNVFLVGGAVRDYILGLEVKDEDFVVTGETVESMKDRGFRFIDPSTAFPVFLDDKGREFALARREKSTGSKYTDFVFETGPEVSLEDDLSRRDFTMNALVMDQKGEVFDLFGGQDHLKQGMLCHISLAFMEDPLRVIRMARFAARFDLYICPHTFEIAQNTVDKLQSLPMERVSQEFVKAMDQAKTPRTFFDVLWDVGAFRYIHDDLYKMSLGSVPAGPKSSHREGSLFEHTLMVLDEMYKIRPGDHKALLTAFFHDIGKIETPEHKLPNHPAHDKKGKKLIEERIVPKMRFNNQINQLLMDGAELHMKILRVNEMKPSKVIDLVERLDSDKGIDEDSLIDLAKADTRGRMPVKEIDVEAIRDRLDAARQAINLVNGQYIKENFDVEGEAFGQVLLQERIRKMKEFV